MSNLVIQWNNAALQAIRDTHPGPPMAARALAILHTCIYDAWAAYEPKAFGTRLADLLRRPQAEHDPTHKSEAISYAAYRALADLFPTEVAKFDDLMINLGYDPANINYATNTPSGIGNLAAQAVMAFRHGDGSNQLGDLHTRGNTSITQAISR